MTSDRAAMPATSDTEAPRSVTVAMRNGARQACPACGAGPLYDGFLKVVPECKSCGEVLSHQRADDAPPYFTIVVVGHLVIGGALALEKAVAPPMWVHMVLWLSLTVLLSLLLLPRIKGALVGLQWALRMHGFGGERDDPVPDPAAGLRPTRSSEAGR